ncbi:MAG: hypothetical protein ACRYFW_08240 [Janthinobacterium lividum]
MTPGERIVQAEADALAARTRLNGSVAAVQARLNPATFVRDARRELDGVTRSARRMADDGAGRARVGGGIAALLLLGIPLLRWRRRRKVAARAARIRGD